MESSIEMSDIKYLIYSIEHTYKSNIATWWRPDSRGYTEHVDQAGEYSKAEAEKICEGAMGNEVMIPKEEVLKRVSQFVEKHSLHRFIVESPHVRRDRNPECVGDE